MKKILIAVIFFCVTASCNDFVDVIPKGNTIPETVDDLAKLMTCGSMSSPLYTFSDISYSIQYFEFYSHRVSRLISQSKLVEKTTRLKQPG